MGGAATVSPGRSRASIADRLLPVDPAQRSIARSLYDAVATLPIVSPHGHVDAAILAEDRPFADPATLLVVDDHYITRLLHASGVPYDKLRIAEGVEPRAVWREFCDHWPDFAGTASGYWMQSELRDVFGIHDPPASASADASFDMLVRQLAAPEFRPRALFERFGVEFLATTDDPLATLEHHVVLRDDASFHGRVVPSFRPDRFLEPARASWADDVATLAATTDTALNYAGYLDALRSRREHFIRHGAVATDHGVLSAETTPLETAEAARLFDRALQRNITALESAAFAAHMLFESARMSVDDGLVMCIHPGVLRDHHGPTAAEFGADVGADIPVSIEFTRALRPLLQEFGTAPAFHLVLFTVDETAWSRELAPLAGFYPSVFLGAPWWFLDAPDAILRFRSAVTETAGFSRSSGFVDDTRGFCSIPARHDAARRTEASFLSRLVVEGRLDEPRAHEIIVDIIDSAPRRVFKL